MKNPLHLFLLVFLLLSQSFLPNADKIRKPVDPVGFATKDWQMDQLMVRINQKFGDKIEETWSRNGIQNFTMWKTVICPHDDYTYASWLYQAILKNVKASTIILIGVAHKAKSTTSRIKLYLTVTMDGQNPMVWCVSPPFGRTSPTIFPNQLI